MTVTQAALAALALAAPAAVPADAVWNTFSTTGTAIAGTTSPADAPKLSVGQYLDDVPVGPSTRYYRVSRSPGATLDVSLVSRPAEPGTSDHEESWAIGLETLDGSGCDSSSMYRSSSYRMNPLVVGNLEQQATNGTCGTATDLVLKVKRTAGSSTPAHTAIRVIETPAVANIDALPAPASSLPPKLRPPVLAAKEITGASGFEEATTVGSGTYVTTIQPGQMVFFKTHLDEGQRATFAVDGPTPDYTAWPSDGSSLSIRADVYNPLRMAFDATRTGTYSKTSLADDQVAALAPVMYRNRDATSTDVRFSRIAGDYYYALVVGRDGATKDSTAPVPVKFSVKVDGTTTTPPQYVKGVVPTESNSPKPSTYEAAPGPDTGAKPGEAPDPAAAGQSATSSTAPSAGIWIGLGIAGAAVLGLLAYAITRRLTAPRPHQ